MMWKKGFLFTFYSPTLFIAFTMRYQTSKVLNMLAELAVVLMCVNKWKQKLAADYG